jgi:hypothetical protein
MPRFRNAPSRRRQPAPTAKWETPDEQVKFALETSRPGSAYDAPGHGTEGMTSMQDKSIPVGLCECGCGERTLLAMRNRAGRGLKGQPLRFLPGHNAARNADAYTVEDRGYTTPCWIWAGTITNQGYPVRRVKYVTQRMHRVYYERANGSILDDLPLDHLCRNRACVNPEHLELVTTAENVRRGALTTLTDGQVAEIRASDEMGTVLAARYGVHPNTVYHVRKGRTWKGSVMER